jgi:hypothetical protein
MGQLLPWLIALSGKEGVWQSRWRTAAAPLSSSTRTADSQPTPGLPDFYWYNIPRSGKNIPNYHKIYQMAIKTPHGRNIYEMSINYTNIFHCKTLQNEPKFGFLVWKNTILQPNPTPMSDWSCIILIKAIWNDTNTSFTKYNVCSLC